MEFQSAQNASRAVGQHWSEPLVLGTPPRHHCPSKKMPSAFAPSAVMAWSRSHRRATISRMKRDAKRGIYRDEQWLDSLWWGQARISPRYFGSSKTGLPSAL